MKKLAFFYSLLFFRGVFLFFKSYQGLYIDAAFPRPAAGIECKAVFIIFHPRTGFIQQTEKIFVNFLRHGIFQRQQCYQKKAIGVAHLAGGRPRNDAVFLEIFFQRLYHASDYGEGDAISADVYRCQRDGRKKKMFFYSWPGSIFL